MSPSIDALAGLFIDSTYELIAHGDAEHRAWLRRALDDRLPVLKRLLEEARLSAIGDLDPHPPWR